MRVQTKLLLFLFLLILLFLLVFVVETIMEQRKINSIFSEKKIEEEAIFDKVLELKGESLENFAFDYTYWDEMASFIRTDNKDWAKEMLDKSILSNYNVNAIWIYKIDASLAYSIHNLGDSNLKEIPLSKETINNLFLKRRFCHFFMNTPSGLMEVRGATVHPTEDVERKTPAQGYFFTARLWNNDYIGKLSRLTTTTIAVKQPFMKEEFTEDISRGLIVFSRILTGPDNNPLVRLDVMTKSKSTAFFYKTHWQQLFLFLIFGIGILGSQSLLLKVIVASPLKLITQTLNTENPTFITRLQKNKDEFGNIAQLINKFFEQKTTLINEIAQRKHIQAALQQSEEKYRGLYDSIKDGIAMTDMKGNILECNQAYLDMLGYTKEEIRKLTYLQLTPQKWHKMNLDIVQHKILKTGYSDVFEKEYIRKDGTVFPIAVRAWLVKDAQGEPQGMWAIVRDISEHKRIEGSLRDAYNKLKQTEMQLVQSAKLASVGQLASGVAHEINNPLTGVLNNVQLMKTQIEQKKDFSPADFREVLGVVEDSALRCKKIIRSLLDFSHVSRGPFKFIVINEIIEKTISLVEQQMNLKNITIQRQLSPDVPHILGDHQLLSQAIFDIISNAEWSILQKSKKEGGIITIKTQYELEKKSVYIFISDTGIGIPKENLDRIFEPFFTTKPQGQGTGLGLSIANSLIRQHNGAIEVESQLDKGTTFKISLPCVLE